MVSGLWSVVGGRWFCTTPFLKMEKITHLSKFIALLYISLYYQGQCHSVRKYLVEKLIKETGRECLYLIVKHFGHSIRRRFN